MHQNVDIFGSDADLFRPERWFERQGEQLQAMERNMELIFGYGRFHCLGKNVAMIELNKYFVEVSLRAVFVNTRLVQGQNKTSPFCKGPVVIRESKLTSVAIRYTAATKVRFFSHGSYEPMEIRLCGHVSAKRDVGESNEAK